MQLPSCRRLLASAGVIGVVTASVAGASAVLSLVSLVQARFGGVAGLDGPISVAVSPNPAHVYVTGGQTVAVFERNEETGFLTVVETHLNGEGAVEGLNGAASVALSPDGLDVYVAGLLDNSVVAFARDVETGMLTFIEAQKNGDGGVEGLEGPASVAVSSDGAHVYVASSVSSSVAVFARNVGTGELTFIEAEFDGVDGVGGLARAGSVVVSPDGLDVYVAGYADEAVAVFGRDPTTGELTFVEAEFEGVGGVSGLVGATFLEVSEIPSGAEFPASHVYVAGFDGDSVAVFARDLGTGELTFVEARFNDDPDVDGLDGATSVRVSPDGATVYVSSCFDAAVATFERDAETGALTFLEATSPAEFSGEQSVAVSPDGAHLYVADNGGVGVLAVGLGTDGLTFLEVDTSVFDGAAGSLFLGFDDDVATDPPEDPCSDGLDDPTCLALSDGFEGLDSADGLDNDAWIDEHAPTTALVLPADVGSLDRDGLNDTGARGHQLTTGDPDHEGDGEVDSDDRSGFFDRPHPIGRRVAVALTPLLAALLLLGRRQLAR